VKETEISDERATGFSVLAGYGSGGTIDDTFDEQCLHSPPAMSTLMSWMILKIDEIIIGISNHYMQPYKNINKNKVGVSLLLQHQFIPLKTRRIAGAFARLILKIQKFACRCILT